MRLKEIALGLLASAAFVGAAHAQASYPCANDLPNPYHLVTNWAQMPRGWNPINAVTVDDKNNFWGVDRCETDDCDAGDKQDRHCLRWLRRIWRRHCERPGGRGGSGGRLRR